jgi:hypothetical protein
VGTILVVVNRRFYGRQVLHLRTSKSMQQHRPLGESNG